MKRKLISSVLCISMLAAVLAGCGKKTENEMATSTEKQKLVIMHQWTDEFVEQNDAEAVAVHDSIERFKEKHPDVEVVVETVSQNAGYESKIKTLAAANELPSVFSALPSMMSTFYDNGQVMDLSSTLETEKDWYDTFAMGAFGDYTMGDKILGVPRCAIVNHVLYWNEEIFKECGIEKFPENADEFLEAVIALKAKGYIPMSSGNKGKYTISSQVMPGILFKFVSNEWYEKLKNYDGASFEDPEAVAAIEYMQKLMEAGLFNEDVNSIDEFQGRELYYSGKAAMYVECSWSVASFIKDTEQDLRDKTSMTIFPAVTGKEDLDSQMVTGQGWGFAVNANLSEDEKMLAVEFLKEMTSNETQAKGVESGSLSILKEVSYDESKLDPFYKEFLDLYNSKEIRVGCPEVQLSTAYMDASYTGYQELSIGNITAVELAAKLQEAHESVK